MDDDAPIVAVVDDEESIRRALLRLLRSAHYRAEAYAGAGEFLASLATRTPQCAVVDLQMPSMTGLELQQELARLGAGLPVIIITAHDEPGTRERCLALGARHYFCKPVDSRILIDSIHRIVTPPAELRPAGGPLGAFANGLRSGRALLRDDTDR